MRDEDWAFYQGRIETLARKLGTADMGLRILSRMVAEGDSKGNLTRYIDGLIQKLRSDEVK